MIAGGYFFYSNWKVSLKTDLWDLIPESAILVYESSKAVENWNEIQLTEIWQNMEGVPYFAGIGRDVEHLDSMAGSQGKLHQLLQSKLFAFSMHRVSQQSLDFLFYVPISSKNDLDMINGMIDHFRKRDDFEFQTRTFQNQVINEAVNLEYQETFSYLVAEDFWIGSFTPHLIEDVIRNVAGQFETSFESANASLLEVAKLDNDQGNLYINASHLPELASVFTDQPITNYNLLGTLARSIFLDLKATDDRVLLNGFALTDDSVAYMGSLEGDQGGAVGFKSLLPMDAATLFHISIQDPAVWHQKLRVYWDRHVPGQPGHWSELSENYNWDPVEFVSIQQQEMGIVTLSTIEEEVPEKLIYLNSSDSEKALLLLNELATKSAEVSGLAVYSESFSNHEIVQIEVDEFPSRLWGSTFSGFDQSFFTVVQDYLVIGSSISALKKMQRSIELEETWGKSIVLNEFLEGSLQEANMSFYVNLSQAWNQVINSLSDPWKSFFDLNEAVFKKFGLARIQFSDIGDKFYTSGALTFNSVEKKPDTPPMFRSRQQAYADSRIVSKPFVVRNHNNGSMEVLLQDSLRALYLIGNQGRILWKDSLDGLIRGAITQIDYYKNKKLQYLLATDRNIHIIDRNGNEVEGFPVSIPTQTRLRNVGVLDYDKSKRYRFIASDESGQIFMLDKQGKLLEGWDPKVLQDQLVFAPQHIRIRNKDCIITIQENGVIHIMNRKGELYPGFPVDLGGATSGPLFIQSGTDFSNTLFTGVTTQGQIVSFDLNGKIHQKQQLVRPTTDTYYQLCTDPLKTHFVIKRQNANRMGVLNRKGEILFEKDYLSTADLKLQYYLLSNNRSIYAVSDPVQQFTYFYNQEGLLINSSPVESNGEIAMLYFESQKQHQIYSVYDNKFSILNF